MTRLIVQLQTLRRAIAQSIMRLIFGDSGARDPGGGTLPAAGIHRILICRSVSTLGDSLTLTPLLQELGRVWPGAEIDIVSRCPVAEQIYGTHFGIGRIIRLPAHPPGHPVRTVQALRHMRSTRYDLAIDPDPQSQSGRLLVMLARKARSLGYSGPHKSGRTTYATAITDMPRHHAMQPVFLLRSALGEHASVQSCPRLDVRLTAAERQQGRDALARVIAGQSSNTYGCIGVFADATGDKRFDAAWWNRFVTELVPGIDGYALVEIVSAASVRSLLAPGYPCFYSGQVRKVAAVLASLSFFVSADCGMMHLGSAVGTPTAGVFKVTEPAEWGPYDDADVAIDARSLTPEAVADKVLSAVRDAASGRSAGSTRHRTHPAVGRC